MILVMNSEHKSIPINIIRREEDNQRYSRNRKTMMNKIAKLAVTVHNDQIRVLYTRIRSRRNSKLTVNLNCNLVFDRISL
jgi:hypothetical protein